MSTKHTPGTWKIDDPLEGQVCILSKDHSSGAEPIIARIFDSSHILLPEQEANARLIAAAPELLAFAQMVAGGGYDMADIMTEARALIAKATGETI